MNLHKYPQSINNICILHKTIFTKKKKKKKIMPTLTRTSEKSDYRR